MIYEVYKVEVKPFGEGKERKVMILQGEGQQNTEERVTMWSNHPDYQQVEVGQKYDWNMKKEDSGTPIPAHPGRTMLIVLF